MNRHYLEELEDMTDEMSEVYEAINHIQGTPWTVNPFTLVVFQMIYEKDYVAGYLQGKTCYLPPSPLGLHQNAKELTEDQKVKFKAWKKKLLLSTKKT